MIKLTSLVKHELIGLRCKVTRATNPSLIGLEGVIVDETKHMLVLSNGCREKKIPKKEVKLKFEKIEIDGKALVGRPEDRVKK